MSILSDDFNVASNMNDAPYKTERWQIYRCLHKLQYIPVNRWMQMANFGGLVKFGLLAKCGETNIYEILHLKSYVTQFYISSFHVDDACSNWTKIQFNINFPPTKLV